MVVHICNPGTGEAEAGESRANGQPTIQSKTLSKIKNPLKPRRLKPQLLAHMAHLKDENYEEACVALVGQGTLKGASWDTETLLSLLPSAPSCSLP